MRVTLTKENLEELGSLVQYLPGTRSVAVLPVLAGALRAGERCLFPAPVPAPGMLRSPLSLLYRAAQEIPPDQMEFLTVDAPQDCIHLIRSMERDRFTGPCRDPGVPFFA